MEFFLPFFFRQHETEMLNMDLIMNIVIIAEICFITCLHLCDNNSVWKTEKKRCKYPISFESHSRCDFD